MGMFNTFFLPHRGRTREIQNKEISCVLAEFRLGDKLLEDAFGVTVITDHFQPTVNHMEHIFEQGGPFDRGLGVSFIIVDGFWLDYAIYPTKKIADDCSDNLIKQYTIERQNFAWKNICNIQNSKIGLIHKNDLGLAEFISSFLWIKEKRKNGRKNDNNLYTRLRDLNCRGFKAKDLTWKKLLEMTRETIRKNFLKEKYSHPYLMSNSEPFEPNLHLRDSSNIVKIGIDINNLKSSTTTEILLKEFNNFNIYFFKRLHKEKADWFSQTETYFQQEVEKKQDNLISTMWGCFFWLEMLKISDLKPPKLHVYKDKLYAPILLHFAEIMGMEDEWLKMALTHSDVLKERAKDVSFINTLSALNYPNTLEVLCDIDYGFLSKQVDSLGRPILIQVLSTALNRDNSSESFDLAKWWLERGADPNQTDSDGNTALMMLIKKANGNINNAWIWADKKYARRFGSSVYIMDLLLKSHSFSHYNKNGETLHQLLKDNSEAYEILQKEEKRRLELSIVNINKNESYKHHAL